MSEFTPNLSQDQEQTVPVTVITDVETIESVDVAVPVTETVEPEVETVENAPTPQPDTAVNPEIQALMDKLVKGDKFVIARYTAVALTNYDLFKLIYLEQYRADEAKYNAKLANLTLTKDQKNDYNDILVLSQLYPQQINLGKVADVILNQVNLGRTAGDIDYELGKVELDITIREVS
jgi:hypothetical protein